MLQKEWQLAQQATPEFLRQFRGIHPVVAQILINRGFDDPTDAAKFLYTRYNPYNPFLIPEMHKAIARIRQAIKRREKIVVYGDFDADGVTSTAVMVEALQKLGADVKPYIPHRVDEGYGLNIPALETLVSEGTSLVITVDCGIRAVEEVKAGNTAGLDIIVTDHHSLGPELPDAYAVVNPKRESNYPETMLAGVGVAFKVVQALIMTERENKRNYVLNGHNGTGPLRTDDYFDLVAIGTVADLMPLNHLENRALVLRGLEALNRAQRPGIRALLEVAGEQPGEVTAMTIGFALGPRINAAGRLDDAMIAYHLLTAKTMQEAHQWAARLQNLNTQRQDITRAAQILVREKLGDEPEDALIFTSHPSFEAGIVGLVAGRLAEEYFRPVIVLEEGETESRASCRSIPQFDITSALDKCADLLVRHGGHALAAGFTVPNNNIETLKERLLAQAQEALDGQVLRPVLWIDKELNLNQLNEELVREIQALEPCGNGNALPVFIARNCHVAEYRTVGKDGRHLKLKLSRAGQPALDAIGFGLGAWHDHMPATIDIAFQLEINEWNGRQNLQANLQDIRPAVETQSVG